MHYAKKLKKNSKKKTKDSIRYLLHKGLVSEQKARSTKTVHASDMIKSGLFGEDYEFCPREYVLLAILKRRRPKEYIKTCNQLVFNFGNMVANNIIHILADQGKAIGDWECSYCERVYKFQKRPDECTDCENDRFRYIECRFISEESGISCGVDLLVPVTAKKNKILEIKSIKDEEFKKLEGPLAEHKWRTNLYMRIVEDSAGPRKNKIITNKASVIYVSKGGWGCKDATLNSEGIKDGPYSPFKEFIIKRDDDSTQYKWDHAVLLKEYKDGERKMPKGLCPSSVCKRADSCSIVKECFSGDYKGFD